MLIGVHRILLNSLIFWLSLMLFLSCICSENVAILVLIQIFRQDLLILGTRMGWVRFLLSDSIGPGSVILPFLQKTQLLSTREVNFEASIEGGWELLTEFGYIFVKSGCGVLPPELVHEVLFIAFISLLALSWVERVELGDPRREGVGDAVVYQDIFDQRLVVLLCYKQWSRSVFRSFEKLFFSSIRQQHFYNIQLAQLRRHIKGNFISESTQTQVSSSH